MHPRQIFALLLLLGSTWSLVSAAEPPEKAGQGPRITRYRGGPDIAENIAFSFDAGDSYSTPAGPRALKRVSGLIAITVADRSALNAVADRLRANGGPLPGYTVHSRAGASGLVLAAPANRRRALQDRAEADRALAAARNAPGVVTATPVFMDPKTGRRLVLAHSVIVKLKPGADPARVFAGASFRRLPGTADQFLIDLPAASAEEIFAESNRRAAQPQVDWAEPDMIPQMVKHFVPNDPLFSKQWHLRNLGATPQRNDADIDAPEAWDTTRGNTNIVIAILDDGVELTHPDLSSNIFRNAGELANNFDDDGNGYIDDINGWDFFDYDNDPTPYFSDDTHGTAVAGVAAAVGNNGVGVAGSGFGCRIMPIRMFGAPFSLAAQSIYYSAGRALDGINRWRGADVISMSLGFLHSTAIDAALTWAAANGRNGKGCPIFISSGNDASRWQTVELSDIPPGTHTYEWEFFKDSDISHGDDTAWLDGIIFPDGTTQNFESTFIPVGWFSYGDAGWFSVQDAVGGNHALVGWNGAGARSVRAGNIFDLEISGLGTSRVNTRSGPLIFSTWVSAEDGYDTLDFYLDSVLEFVIADDPFAPIFTELDYPASHPDTIAVGASTDFDFRADYSCYAGDLDFVAPSDGGYLGIITTDLIGADGYTATNYVTQFGGTSASCPLAAGVAGLILSVNTNLSAANVRRLMQVTCDQVGGVAYANGTNQFYGYGRINAARAVTNATLRINSVERIGGSIRIRFPTVNGWAYDLERANSLTGPWNIIQSNLLGTGAVIEFSDAHVTSPAIRRFYRVRLRP